MLNKIEKTVMGNKINGVKRMMVGQVDYVQGFISDHPIATGFIIGMTVLAAFEAKVIDAADEVIGELGGWD